MQSTSESLAEEVGMFVRLEDFYSSVTFLEEGRRRAKPLDLRQRIGALRAA